MKIEKGIPIPPVVQSSASVEPFDQMEVGDSVVVPRSKVATMRERARRVLSDGLTITTRSISDSEVRIWVIKDKHHVPAQKYRW